MAQAIDGLASKPYPEGRGETGLGSASGSLRVIGCLDLCIELHPSTLPISMTLHRMASLSCRNSRSRYKNCWTKVSLDRALHHEALQLCLQRRKTRPFGCALTIDS